MAFLEVKNLQKRFGNTEVLKGIDFSLEKGDVLVIIGSSGSGKTTLLPVPELFGDPQRRLHRRGWTNAAGRKRCRHPVR